MKIRRKIFFALSVLFLFGAGFLGYEIKIETDTYQEKKLAYTKDLELKERLLNLNNLILPDSDYTVRKIVSDDHLKEANNHYANAVNYAWMFAAFALFFLIATTLLSRGFFFEWRVFSAGILVIAISCLIIGISIPILELGGYLQDLTINVEDIKDNIEQGTNDNIGFGGGMLRSAIDAAVEDELVIPGRTYVLHQVKSVSGVLGILIKNNNYFVAILIGLFSIIVPIIKLLSSFIILFSVNGKNYKKLKRFIDLIAKWSMADVFVVAAYLVFFSFTTINVGAQTESYVLLGLYFFAVYVLLGVFSSYPIKKVMKSELKA